MKETCSCGAKFAIAMPALPLPEIHWEKALEMLQAWRRDHRHEFTPAEPEIPLVVESGSSHERHVEDWLGEDRAPAGFARNA